ncbi:sulfatase-like hydrolase/transferase [Microbulbifer elongatus]|uniref:sulfatase-like hydrolase/transferase n=1 Tax=Microbulbifer elongatus TaxID=86173 RepID=UPI001E5F6F95|nr:sulfatase-like hydrolase/transferase [Microbulbifer elongatus]
MIKLFSRPTLVSIFLVYVYQLLVVLSKAGPSGDLASNLLTTLSVPALWFDLTWFVLANIVLLVVWNLLLCFSFLGLGRIFPGLRKPVLVIICFAVSLCFIFSLNAYMFPLSTFTWEVATKLYPYVALVTGAVWVFLVVGGVVVSWSHAYKVKWASVLLLGFPLYVSISNALTSQESLGAETLSQPNIFVIGVDALRPDYVGAYGRSPSVTPNIDRLLAMAERFPNAYSPMGRTHVAWYSMLRGEYPESHGLRFNLGDKDLIERKIPLLQELNSAGYHTIWAIDERRFNNFSEEYGFLESVGPKLGAADFILGFLYDNPLSNWLINSEMGSWLFPFVHSNRAMFKVYNPYTFVNKVSDRVAAVSSKPVFLAVHLTMPHYPFLNHMMSDPVGYRFSGKTDPAEYLYMSMLQLVDKQVGSLIQQLKAMGKLNNSIVYLVSDHGEGLSIDAEQLEGRNPYASLDLTVAGHGTNLLNTVQNKVVLSRVDFRNPASLVDESLRSLIDVGPTIAIDAGVSPIGGKEAKPLTAAVAPDRTLVMESSFYVDALNQSAINEFMVALESMEFYTVDVQARVHLKDKVLPLLMKSKQYAAISEGYLLPLLPYMSDDAIILDVSKNNWWPMSAHGGDLDGVDYDKLLMVACDYRSRSEVEPLEVCDKAGEL